MAAMKDLSEWRHEIDELDRQIVALLNQRAECVLNLAPLKRRRHIDILDRGREEEVLRKLRAANSGPLPTGKLVAGAKVPSPAPRCTVYFPAEKTFGRKPLCLIRSV